MAVPTLFPCIPLSTRSDSAQQVESSIGQISASTSTETSPPVPSTSQQLPSTSEQLPSTLRDIEPQVHKGRRRLFRGIENLSRADATPRKVKLISLLSHREDHIRKLKTLCKKRAHDIKALSNLDESDVVRNLFKDMPNATANFLIAQLRCAKREPKGRRWTVMEKVIALALLKRSPKCYQLLSKIVAMPSNRTLLTLLHRVPFNVGINEHLFTHLKQCLTNDQDRLCVLLFDEMDIKENICYDGKDDRIVGFEDFGDHAGEEFANKALVFMCQGLNKSWKQPVAYYFSYNGCKADNLIILLNEVISAAKNIGGLDVVATVCDMGSSNVKAMKDMKASIQEPFFEHEGQKIYTMFDPPHLLKCTTSLFRRHDVSLPVSIGNNTEHMVAKFDDIRAAHKIDVKSPLVFRAMPKLKDAHMAPVMRFAMKVSIAAQTMSRTVAAFLYTLMSRGELEQRSIATATFIQEVDELFDSFNGSQKTAPDGKPLKSSISDTSNHATYWSKAFKAVKSWEFLRKTKRGNPMTAKPPSQYGWMVSIRAIQSIWTYVRSKGLAFLRGRILNQDSLENLFCIVRAGCGSADNPTPIQFIGSLKAAILNGLTKQGLQRSNCEDDESQLLSNLLSFVTVGESSNDTDRDLGVAPLEPHISPSKTMVHDIADAVSQGNTCTLSVAYVSGFIVKRVMQEVAGCETCFVCLCASPSEPHNIFIKFKEWSDDKGKLFYPSENLVVAVGHSVSLLETFLPIHRGMSFVERTAMIHLKNEVDLTWVSCPAHTDIVSEAILRGVSRIAIPWWCNRQNQKRLRDKRESRETKKKLKKMAHK